MILSLTHDFSHARLPMCHTPICHTPISLAVTGAPPSPPLSIPQILDNLQLTVRGVHTRYEDSSNLKGGRACALGFQLGEVHMQSVSKDGITRFVERQRADAVCKLISIRRLSTYLYADCRELFSALGDDAAILAAFAAVRGRGDGGGSGSGRRLPMPAPLLAPLSARLLLELRPDTREEANTHTASHLLPPPFCPHVPARHT